jgi:uncharacterized protein YbjT (DUF2867 family)
VVRVLRAKGIATAAHVRPDSAQLAQWRARFEPLGAEVDVTPWESEAMTATLARRRPELVFALLGTTQARTRADRRQAGRAAGYEAIDYGLTMLLYGATLPLLPRPRFVYLSSTGVSDGANNAYLAVRARVETALREGAVPYTIARPSFITGPGRDEFRPAERLGALVVDGALMVVGWFGGGRLRDRYRSTSNRVLAEALVRLALDPAAAGRTVESEGLREV